MRSIASKLMTAEEFYVHANLPENRDRDLELVRGEVVEMSKPGKRHGLVCANLIAILMEFARRRGKGYPCANDTGVVVERDPDTVRGPDVLFFDDAESFDEVDEKYGETPPLLAVEVLAPNDRPEQILRRVDEQLRFGTRLVWVLDPEARSVSVHRADRTTEVVESDGELTGEDVLPEFRCRVADLFAMPGGAGEHRR